MVNVEMKLTGDITSGLDQFEATIKGSVMLSGVAAMAKPIYDEARINCPVSAEGHWFYGTHQKYFFPAGTLKASIYRVFAKDKSSEFVKTYDISWNHKKAPYGFMVEFGTSHSAGHPFMRPAFDHIQEAIAAGNERMKELLAGGGK